MSSSRVVFDASALLAALYSEPGAERVQQALDDAVLSSVNLAEVAGKLRMNAGWTKEEVAIGLDLPLDIVGFNAHMARLAGEMLPRTSSFGLSLGDRACLATAINLGIRTVFTTDTAWGKLDLEKLDVVLIR